MKDRRRKSLGELGSRVYATYMRIVASELAAMSIEEVCELGNLVGGTRDHCGALREVIERGDAVANIVCTAACAALMSEIEARKKEGRE